jgi:DNA-binding NtrC family response regulator
METTRLLLVDDEASLRLTLAANLELEGFEVVEAESAEQALALLEADGAAERLQVVLSDVRMPGMNGIDLFGRIKAHRPGIPVVFMTAFAGEDLVQAAVREGAFAVLPKPCDPVAMARTLRRAAGGSLVLVVDAASEAEGLAEGLRVRGLHARAISDGQQAVELAGEGKVDVCALEMVLAGMTGPELMRRLQTVDPSIAIIAVSGAGVPDLFEQAAALGAFGCMRKPLALEELVSTIAAARGRPRRPC